MPRPCSVCSHPERLAIEDAFRNGTAFRNIAKRHNVGVSALFRHKQHVPLAEQSNTKSQIRETEQEVPTGALLAAKLPPKKRAYVEHRIAGQSRRAAALAAGYSSSMASHAAQKIEGQQDVREAFTALIRESIPPERIAKAISEGLEAMETKFFSSEGEIKDSRDVIAWSERRQYAAMAAEMGGYFEPDKSDRDQGGPGVILILPDPPKPAPVIEAKVVDVSEDESGPTLILPDRPGGKTHA